MVERASDVSIFSLAVRIGDEGAELRVKEVSC